MNIAKVERGSHGGRQGTTVQLFSLNPVEPGRKV